MLTPGILWLADRYPLERKSWPKWVGIHFAGASVFAVLTKVQWDLVSGLVTPAYLYRGFTIERLLRSVMMAYDLGFVLYWGILLTVLAADFYGRFQESRMQLVRAQLNPHFLFNALHGVSELIHEDPEGAESNDCAAERTAAALARFFERG